MVRIFVKSLFNMNCSRSLLPFFMDKDIRNYFGAKPKNGEKNGSNDRKETKKRPKPVALSSSDSEDELKKEMMQNDSKRPKKKAAARPVISSSDSGMNYYLTLTFFTSTRISSKIDNYLFKTMILLINLPQKMQKNPTKKKILNQSILMISLPMRNQGQHL